jgi:hypothetical protein
VRNSYKVVAGKWLKLSNQLEEAEADRALAKGKERQRLIAKIKRLRPLVEKARKAADAAYSQLCQAA